ncbi:hypothetical protein [Natrinema sp. CGMCC1.2065]|uniref:hypothetical protein n=1 Tax=Natrinema sp. CGMCC1.2065 TaxID=3445767 RepID=UPI003F49FEDD
MTVDRDKARSARSEQLDRKGEIELQRQHEAAAVAGPEIRADGSGESDDQTHAEDTDMTDEPSIKPGDVALDRTQGRPVHVLEDTGQTVLQWTNENGYDLLDNYGNGRCGATAEDRVFEVVYCSSIQSEPSKIYAMPESRLDRVETEKADGGRQVYDRIVVDVLDQLFQRAGRDDEQAVAVLEAYATDAGVDADVVDEARELAEAAQLGGEA